MKQFGTRWEEDVGELWDLPDHVHCGQNSLQMSGASDRAGVQQVGPLTSTAWQTREFWERQMLGVLCLTFLRT
jgi:hypothetical protein